MMNPLFLIIAFGPLGVYLLAMALIHRSRFALVVSGENDRAALALALIGFFLTGPVQLFFPVEAFLFWGAVLWGLFSLFYILTVVFIGFFSSPEIVVYNISANTLRTELSKLALSLDAQARWAADALALPQMELQLYLRKSPKTNAVSLVSIGAVRNYSAWKLLEKGLVQALKKKDLVPSHSLFLFWGSLSCLIFVFVAVLLWTEQQEILETLQMVLSPVQSFDV